MRKVDQVPASRTGRPAKFDYPALFDGGLNEVDPRAEYETNPHDFAIAVRRYAARKGIEVEVHERGELVYVRRL
jgi:hypothetical protein